MTLATASSWTERSFVRYLVRGLASLRALFLRWHRTPKSAALTLRDQPQTWQPRTNSENYLAHSMLGEVCFREELQSAWKESEKRIEKWFEETVTLGNVLVRCDEQRLREVGGIRFVRRAEIVHALTLGRMGRIGEAQSELDKCSSQIGVGPEERKNLAVALAPVRRN